MKHLILILLLFMSTVIANTSNEDSGQFFIYPSPKGWEPARVADVLKVVRSAGDALIQHFPQKKLNPVILKNDKEGPRVNYKRGEQNEYIVLVDVKGRLWSKLTYQFSHEMCHILSNYGNKSGKNQWFGESLCETMSLYVLEEMSHSWETNPPYPNWKSYAKKHRNYLDKELAMEHRTIKRSLAEWFSENREQLREDPYIREKNEVVGTAIYHLIQSGKFKVSSMQYLNLGLDNDSKSFSNYIKDWYENSPKSNKESVRSVAKLFEIEL